MKKRASQNSSDVKKKNKQDTEKRDFLIAVGIIAGIVALILCAHFLPPIWEKFIQNMKTVDFSQGENYIIDEDGNKFFALNRSVKAIKPSTFHGEMGMVKYHLIPDGKEDTNPPKYIVEVEDGYSGTVYRSEGEEDITIKDFVPHSADICLPESSYPHDNFFRDNKDDNALVKLVYDTLVNGEEETYPLDTTQLLRINLKSDVFPGLYYSVAYFKDKNGKTYLEDIGGRKAVLCPDELTVRLGTTEE